MNVRRQRIVAALGLAIAVAACADAPTANTLRPDASRASNSASRSYVVLGSGNSLPSGFAASMAAIGGSVLRSVPAIGMAVVTSDNPNFVSSANVVRGVSDVAEDVVVQ
ncbi:MAG: hypothetical protein ABIT38_03605, partial [Gemmatimonadaceae bacterium]